MRGAWQRHVGTGLWLSLPPKAVGTNSDKEAGLTARLSTSRPPLSLLERGGVNRRLALANRRLRTRRVLVENMRGEWQRGATLANVSTPPKATGINKNKEADLPARPPARRPSLSLLERGGGGRRLALAGRRLLTRCVLVHELAGRGDRRLGGWRRPCQMG